MSNASGVVWDCAKTLLMVTAHHPSVVLEALHAACLGIHPQTSRGGLGGRGVTGRGSRLGFDPRERHSAA